VALNEPVEQHVADDQHMGLGKAIDDPRVHARSIGRRGAIR